MKERRLYKRHSVKFPSRIEAIMPSGKKKILDLETKNISIGGAFIYTKESSSFPEGTRFIIDLTIPNDRNKELMVVTNLMECTGTLVRSTSEGIAIQCESEYWDHGSERLAKYNSGSQILLYVNDGLAKMPLSEFP